MRKVCSKLAAIRATEGNNAQKENGSVRADESVALNTMQGRP